MKTYTRTIGEKTEFSTLQTMKLLNDYPERGWVAGQTISFIGGPHLEADMAIVEAEGWTEYIPPVPPPPGPQTEPSEYEKIQALNILNADKIVALDDESALVVKALLTPWIEMLGKQVEAGLRLYWDDRLWKVLQAHTPQADWTPDVTPALYTEITLEDGTIDHPIHYNNNMELVEGLYYTQDGDKYLCFRSTGVPVYNPLSQLVGLYVNVVNS